MTSVSVIVPIFKAEATLLRCLDSLKSQTFKDFEVLMIDDGSPDRCGEMIDDYAKKDQRFKAFHKENGGVSSARQFGIDYAIGDYTIHADPDDWVETTMLEDLYRKAIEDDADMVICDFFENTYKGQKYIVQRPSSLEPQIVLKELFVNLHGSCCNKLVKKSLYNQYFVRFPFELSFCEDQYVNCAFLMHKIKISYLSQAYYHYLRNNDCSLSRSYTNETYNKDLIIRDTFDSLFKDSPYRDVVYQCKTLGLMSRAFWGGEKFFSSNLYRKLFFKNRKYAFMSKKGFVECMLLYLSCLGFYKPIRKIVGVGMKVKKNVLHCVNF